MKGETTVKHIRLLSLLVLVPLLTACKLRFGDTLYEVPWWVILVLLCAVLLIILVPALKNTRRVWFTCPGCNRKFKPSSAVLLFSLHANDHCVLKCPHCNQRHMCAPSYDQERD